MELTERGLVAGMTSVKPTLTSYAIGDLVRGQCWQHKAMEGMIAVERIHGEKVQVNYDTIINGFTHPEIA